MDPIIPSLNIPEHLAQGKSELKLPKLGPVPRLGEQALAKIPTWGLDQTILDLGDGHLFTLRHACAGVIVFGKTGSGKTSGPGQYLALHYLQAGFGGIVFCVKPDEGSTWVEYAQTAGRSQDVIRITTSADNQYWFDFLAWEMEQPGSSTQAIVKMIAESAAVLRKEGSGNGSNEQFWEASSNDLVKNAIDLLKLAFHEARVLVDQGHLPADEWLPPYQPTILTLLELITSAGTKAEDFDNKLAIEQSLNLKCLQLAKKVAAFHSKSNTKRSKDLVNDFKLTVNFWKNEWAKPGDSKLRDNITAFARSTMTLLERGAVASLFHRVQQVNPLTQKLEWVDTVTPDMLGEGKIIIVDVPVNKYGEVGKLAACIWKYVVQRFIERRRPSSKLEAAISECKAYGAAARQKLEALEAAPLSTAERLLPEGLMVGSAAARRDARRAAQRDVAYAEAKLSAIRNQLENSVRPVFIWGDECQKIVVKTDVAFQSTARQARALTVFLTQSTAMLDDQIGKDSREGLVSNLANKFFCLNDHVGTNQWASDMVGSDFRPVETTGENYGAWYKVIPSLSRSRKMERLALVEPVEFTRLSPGGKQNGSKVGAYMLGAEKFGPTTTWLKLAFDQNIGKTQTMVPEQFRLEAEARVRQELN